MSRIRHAILLFLLWVLIIPYGAAIADSKSTTLEGEFIWSNRDYKGKLEAEFRPTKEGHWEVSFQFVFRERKHVYTGTAQGSLTDGPLEGEVKNEDGKRTFVFEGSFKQGRFSGKHRETTPGRGNDGTLTLTLGQGSASEPV